MKKVFLAVIALVVFMSCSKQENYQIGLNKVGAISENTTIKDLKTIFKNDSIVSRLSEGGFGYENPYILDEDTHLIFEKGGNLLLSITPVTALDSLSKIKSVTLFDEKYKTDKNLTVHSTFNDLNVGHHIGKIEATFQLATVFVDDINATITLDKKTIGLKTFDLGTVDKSQIPNETPFTSFTVWFKEL